MHTQSTKSYAVKAVRRSVQISTSLRLCPILLAPCITLSTIAVQPNNAQAQSLFERRFQQRLEKRIEQRRDEAAKLSENQKEHLFQTRRHWMISTYDKRLALLEAGQDVCKIRRALRRERTAGSNNSVLGIITLNSGSRPSTACVSDWGCHPCGLH